MPNRLDNVRAVLLLREQPESRQLYGITLVGISQKRLFDSESAGRMLEDNDHEFRVQDSIAVVWPRSQFGEAIYAGSEEAAEQEKCPNRATKAAMTTHGIKEIVRRCATQRESVYISLRLHVNEVRSE
jgi:hypothetical protein